MKILFAASEVAPFIKTGGLADVAGSLPTALAECGHDVHVILPLYEKIAPQWREKMTFCKNFTVPLSWRKAYCGVFSLEQSGVTYWFVDNEYYFKRDKLYSYFDDGERFAFFSRAIIEVPVQMDWIPDVIHCNDWQTALVPVYLTEAARIAPKLADTKTVFTIHNIEYQGQYSRSILEDVFGLDRGYYHDKLLAHRGSVNLMKGAIYSSDYVTTVSPSYAWELHDSFYAHGLEKVIDENDYKLKGILNGIDTQLYDPSTGNGMAHKYTVDHMQGKRECKTALQKAVGLTVDPNVPIIACVSRLVHHKGIDLITHVLPEIMEMNVQMVVLGTGERKYEEALRSADDRYKGRFAARLFYSAELSNTIYSGATMLLMPSIAEPCGLSQIIAMRYGTLPLVRETGGLKDTVIPYNQYDGTGNGFSFSDVNAHDMLHVLRMAVDLYHNNKETWDALAHNAMTTDFGWGRSAKEYTKIYQQITGGRL